MKKHLAVLMVVILFFSYPVKAKAVDFDAKKSITYEEFTESACSVFPEYADNIVEYKGEATEELFSEKPTIVVSRMVNENEVWTYQEYSTRAAVVSYYKMWGVTNTSYGAGYTDYTGTLTVTCNMSNDIFQRCNFKYRISSGYDSIISGGTATGSSCSSSLIGSRNTETATAKAYHQYLAYFLPREYLPVATYACTITFYVGNDNFSISVV